MENTRFKRILLLDDEPGVVFALRLLLSALKFEVKDYTEPEKAVEALRGSQEYDLFLCDLKMPRMNGMAVLEATRTLRPTLPFLLMSAHATDADVALAKSKGANGFIPKPFAPEDLMRVLQSL